MFTKKVTHLIPNQIPSLDETCWNLLILSDWYLNSYKPIVEVCWILRFSVALTVTILPTLRDLTSSKWSRILRQNSCAPPCERPSNLHDSHALCGCRALCGAYDLVLANDSKKNQSDRGKAWVPGGRKWYWLLQVLSFRARAIAGN